MELITIVLSSLFTLIAPVGLVADQVAEGLIRDRIHQAEALEVRIDNVPNFQLAGGRVERFRLAGRGVYPVPEFRIDVIDVETDPIDLDLGALQSGEVVLDEPIQSAAHLILKTDDINALLKSQRVQALLDTLRFSLPGGTEREANRYGLANPQVAFLPENRLRITVDLEDRVQSEKVEARVESGFDVIDGHRLVLLEPMVMVDGQAVPHQLVDAFLEGIRSELTLKQLEEVSVIARVLKFELRPEALDVAVFVRVDPDSPLLENSD
ncbi:MAG: DUF2993 domain-containing protein [Leptolyngbya sp. SIO1D8]|nr:DUF2993 domain-containing protein [Leptolyngbya sp. SIO1D8]